MLYTTTKNNKKHKLTAIHKPKNNQKSDTHTTNHIHTKQKQTASNLRKASKPPAIERKTTHQHAANEKNPIYKKPKPTQSTANIKESHVTEPSRRKKRYVRTNSSPLTNHMHKLRQTHPTRHRSHKIPLPQLRRNPNQTRRQMQKIRQTLQMPQMQLHRTIERFNSWAQ